MGPNNDEDQTDLFAEPGDSASDQVSRLVSPLPPTALVPPGEGSASNAPVGGPGESTPTTRSIAAPPPQVSDQAKWRTASSPAIVSRYNRLLGQVVPADTVSRTGISNPPQDPILTSGADPVEPTANSAAPINGRLLAGGPPSENPDPNSSLRPGGTNPGAQPGALSSFVNSLPQNSTTVTGPSGSSTPRWLRILGNIGNVALSTEFPGVAQYIPQTSVGKAREASLQRQEDESRAKVADEQSQTQERVALGKKADAIAAADQPFTMSAEQAAKAGHPELEGLPITQRTYDTLVTTKQKADTSAEHNKTWLETNQNTNDTRRTNNQNTNDTRLKENQNTNNTRVRTTAMHDATSRANNNTTNETRRNGSGSTKGGQEDTSGRDLTFLGNYRKQLVDQLALSQDDNEKQQIRQRMKDVDGRINDAMEARDRARGGQQPQAPATGGGSAKGGTSKLPNAGKVIKSASGNSYTIGETTLLGGKTPVIVTGVDAKGRVTYRNQ